MKILFGGALTIFIREEDFTEINIDQNLISYTRPNGTHAFIKFKYTIPGSTQDQQDPYKLCTTPKWQEGTPAAGESPKASRLTRKIVRFAGQMKFKTL